MFVTNLQNLNLDPTIKLKTRHLKKVDEVSVLHVVVVVVVVLVNQ